MPNRTAARIYRGASLFCMVIGVLFGIASLRSACSELSVRRHWSLADGNILTYEQHSRTERASGRGTLSSWTVYWIEFQVEFDAPMGVAPARTGARPF